MATITKKRLDELAKQNEPRGEGLMYLMQDDSNYSVTLSVLKTFFADSTLKIFSDFVDVSSNIVEGAPTEEEGAVIDIVYLTAFRTFGARKTIGQSVNYFFEFNGKEDYADGYPRADRVFLCLADKGQYMWNGSILQNLFDSVKINVMTEDELNNLQNPIEGAIYATYEE